jgi:hypothetical protein
MVPKISRKEIAKGIVFIDFMRLSQFPKDISFVSTGTQQRGCLFLCNCAWFALFASNAYNQKTCIANKGRTAMDF